MGCPLQRIYKINIYFPVFKSDPTLDYQSSVLPGKQPYQESFSLPTIKYTLQVNLSKWEKSQISLLKQYFLYCISQPGTLVNIWGHHIYINKVTRVSTTHLGGKAHSNPMRIPTCKFGCSIPAYFAHPTLLAPAINFEQQFHIHIVSIIWPI